MTTDKVPITAAMWETTKYIAGPMVGIMIGAVIGNYTHPSNKIVNILRAAAAGIVLAATSTELIPDIAEVEDWKGRGMVLFGIIMGAALMIVIRTIFSKYTNEGEPGTIPWEMVIAIAVDFFIDAILIGMSLTLGPGLEANTGLVMTLALGFEMMLLTVTTASQMKLNKVGKGAIFGVAAMLVGVVMIGSYLGNFIAHKFKGTPYFYGLLAFGVSTLIWLIVEELLADISMQLDSRLSATMIFIGFMMVIASGWMGHAH